LTDPKPQQELVEDFEDSADIYNYLAKSNMRIIEDSFSYTRNHRLYSAFYQLESMLRLRLLSSNQFHKSRPIRDYTKTLKLDHRVSMFTFSELYETLLLSPASDEYVLSKWEETDKKGTTLLELSKNLKGLDELNFPLTASELKFLLNQRNQCMHFRVTTLDEYSRTIRLVNKYILSRQSKKLNDIVAKNIASMQETMAKVDTSALNTLLGIHSEAAQSITKSILAASKPMTDLQETIAKLRGPLNEMAENALKTAVPMQRAARAAAKLRPLDTDQNSKPKNKP
jgi:hypothetical protein